MEIRQYLNLFKRWAWVLVLGLILGILGGYALSLYQTPLYQSNTKILIMQSQDQNSEVFNLNSQQLAQTFTELLVTRPVIEETSKRLGYPISSNQVRVQMVREAQMIQLTVQDSDPVHSADIANTMVDVFLNQNESLQSSRFAETEESLLTQLQQLEEQIQNLKDQATLQTEENLDAQVELVTKTISDLQAEITTLNRELITLENSGVAERIRNAQGQFIMATPTFTVDQIFEIQTRRDRLDELQSLLSMYQNTYVQLTLSGSGNRNPSEQDQLQAALVLYQQLYSNVLNNYEQVRFARLRSTPNIVQVEEARPPSNPIRPKPFNNMVLGGILGLILGGGIAFMIEYLDDTMRTSEEVADVLQLPVLAHIGHMVGSTRNGKNGQMPYVISYPRSPIAESFRTLRTNLEFSGIDKPLKTILITSPGASEGKTTVAVNLAVVMAQSGKRVILLDADLRHPQVHHVLGIPNRIGLSDVLRDHAALQKVSLSWRNNHMSVITSGSLPPNPAEVLSSEKMANILKDLKNQADVVIVDGPPFLLADASVLASRTDGTLLVIQPTKTRANIALAMLDQLERAGARIIGIALNRVPTQDLKYYYKSLKDYSDMSYSYSESIIPAKDNKK